MEGLWYMWWDEYMEGVVDWGIGYGLGGFEWDGEVWGWLGVGESGVLIGWYWEGLVYLGYMVQYVQVELVVLGVQVVEDGQVDVVVDQIMLDLVLIGVQVVDFVVLVGLGLLVIVQIMQDLVLFQEIEV